MLASGVYLEKDAEPLLAAPTVNEDAVVGPKLAGTNVRRDWVRGYQLDLVID